MYKNAKILVTGGAGFIGINLVNELVHRGASVTVVDLKDPPQKSIPTEVNFIKTDFTNTEAYKNALDECEFCFHLAARTDLSGKSLHDYAVNYDGTQKLIEAIKNNNKIKRFMFTSTQLVVGIFNETRFLDESEPYKTRTLYGQSKTLGEKVTIELCKKNNIPFTILRPTSVYGPYGNEPYRDFFLMIKKNRYFHFGKADNLISMAYIKNIVEQMVYLSAHAGADGGIFFASDLYPYTMRQFANAGAEYWGKKLSTIPDFIVYPAAYALGLLKILGFSPPLYPFRLKNIKSNYCYSLSNSLKLGYMPKYGLSQGISETLKWYDENDPLFGEIDAGK